MSTLLALVGVASVASLFFVVIPGVGATTVRRAWRQFRASVESASLLPTLRLGEGVTDGSYRFFGTLEAIQGADLLWLTDGRLTVGAHLAGVRVFLLSSLDGDGEPQLLPWRRVYSLPAGTKVFVAGRLRGEQGRRIFRGESGQPPVVLIYAGDEGALMTRAIESGRGRNEYWNQFTVMSLVTGAFLLAVLALVMLGEPQLRVPAILAMAVAAAPVAHLLPPGVAAYLVYRTLWRRARRLRVERDLARLPLRYFPREQLLRRGDASPVRLQGRLPDGEAYLMAPLDQVEVEGDPRPLLVSQLLQPSSLRDRDTYLFGTPHPEGAAVTLRHPADPLAELVVVSGHPIELSALAVARARVAALLAGASIAAALSVNVLGLLLLLSLAVR